MKSLVTNNPDDVKHLRELFTHARTNTIDVVHQARP